MDLWCWWYNIKYNIYPPSDVISDNANVRGKSIGSIVPEGLSFEDTHWRKFEVLNLSATITRRLVILIRNKEGGIEQFSVLHGKKNVLCKSTLNGNSKWLSHAKESCQKFCTPIAEAMLTLCLASVFISSSAQLEVSEFFPTYTQIILTVIT